MKLASADAAGAAGAVAGAAGAAGAAGGGWVDWTRPGVTGGWRARCERAPGGKQGRAKPLARPVRMFLHVKF